MRHSLQVIMLVAAVLLGVLLFAACSGSETSINPSSERSAAGKPPPPSPTPANPEICYIAAGVGLMVMDVDGSNPRKVYSGGGSPGWSPDGAKLVFPSSNALWRINLDGSGLFEILQDETAYLGGTCPAWSPAAVPGRGFMIAYDTMPDAQHLADGAPRDLWLISPEGGTPQRITNTPDEPECYPTWSPDGARLAYEGYTSESDGATFKDLYVRDFVNGTVTRIAIGGPCADRNRGPIELDWARTQDKIAFVVGDIKLVDGANVMRLEIWVVDLNDPANPKQLASESYAHFNSPSWSPNDGQIVYCRRQITSGGKTPGSAIWKMNADGSNKTLLAAPSGKAWSLLDPDWKR